MDSSLSMELGRFAQDLQLRRRQVESVVELLEAGYTPSFIARYRKSMTEALGEEQVRAVRRRLEQWRHLGERREGVLKLAEAKGKLTDAFKAQVTEANDSTRLDDLAIGLRPRKNSFAAEAREKGLEPLAEAIWDEQEMVGDLAETIAGVVDAEKGLATVEDVAAGLHQLLAEKITEHADARCAGRAVILAGRLVANLVASARPPESSHGGETQGPPSSHGQGPPSSHGGRGKPNLAAEYRHFANFAEPLQQVLPHKLLIINRGERQNALEVHLDYDRAAFEKEVRAALALDKRKHGAFIGDAVPKALDALRGYLERDVRGDLTEAADDAAARVLVRSVRNLLLQPGVARQKVLAIDPGMKTGCRWAVLDEAGVPIETGVVHPFSQKRKRKKKKRVTLVSEVGAVLQASKWLSEIEANEAKAAAETGAVEPAESVAPPIDLPGIEPTAVPVIPASAREEAGEKGEPAPVLPADSFYRSTSPQDLPEGGGDATGDDAVDQAAVIEAIEPEPMEAVAAPASEPASEPTGEVAVAEAEHSEHSEPAAESHGAVTSAEEAEGSGEHEEEGDEEEEERAAPGQPPLPPRRERAKRFFAELANKHGVKAVALGAGQACRDIEDVLSEMIAEGLADIRYAIVPEAAAMAYCNGVVAREEFPDLDASIRVPVALGRRMQD
ncbi:MAG TPA: Tex-like N-terminal domain-containing protein, partial [Planctomycetia bacterium]|nr:Tex-like N-terminal domain-containing protein [Planctomycetia bacterium]